MSKFVSIILIYGLEKSLKNYEKIGNFKNIQCSFFRVDVERQNNGSYSFDLKTR